MAEQAFTEVDLETARKWFNVGTKVYSYKHGDDNVALVPNRAELALADYRGEIFFIETNGKN